MEQAPASANKFAADPPVEPSVNVLVPLWLEEALTIKQAAALAGRSEGTLRSWCGQYQIGRRVGPSAWRVSKIALAMFLESNWRALQLYHRGDRESPPVAAYYDRLGIGHLIPGGAR